MHVASAVVGFEVCTLHVYLHKNIYMYFNLLGGYLQSRLYVSDFIKL